MSPATTHTEVYRRFQGEAKRGALRFLPLWRAEMRVAVKRKLPLVLLFGPSAIATVIYCFLVYANFALAELQNSDGNPMFKVATTMAGQLLAVRSLIELNNEQMAVFALLATTWYGAGLICEDRRAGAHLLYFSRPLTRTDYLLGKLATAASFGAFAMLVPSVVICGMAVLASPEWSFLSEQGDVIVGAMAFSLLWTTVVGVLVLAVSSLVPKRLFALVGVMGLFLFTEAIAGAGQEIGETAIFGYLSPGRMLAGVGKWLLAAPSDDLRTPVAELVAVGTMLALGLGILVARLRRMELAS